MADYGGSLYAAALNNAGASLGAGIQQALDMYHQRHVQQMQADSQMNTLSMMRDPSNPKKSVLGTALGQLPKGWEQMSRDQKVQTAAGTQQALQFYSQLRNVNAQTQYNLAHANYIASRENIPDNANQPIYHPQTGEFIGVYDAKGHPSFFKHETGKAGGGDDDTNVEQALKDQQQKQSSGTGGKIQQWWQTSQQNTQDIYDAMSGQPAAPDAQQPAGSWWSRTMQSITPDPNAAGSRAVSQQLYPGTGGSTTPPTIDQSQVSPPSGSSGGGPNIPVGGGAGAAIGALKGAAKGAKDFPKVMKRYEDLTTEERKDFEANQQQAQAQGPQAPSTPRMPPRFINGKWWQWNGVQWTEMKG